jgi:hypothetical protein
MDETNKLFALTGTDFNVLASTMLESMIQNISEKIPDIPASFWDKHRRNLDTESLRGSYTDIYKRHFTPQEISGLIKFYESPLGRKAAKCEQQITQEGQAASEAYFNSLVKEVMEELLAEDS